MKYLVLLLIIFLPFKVWTQEYISPSPLQTLEARVSDEGLEIGEFFSNADITLNAVSQIVYVTHYQPIYTQNPDGLEFYDLLEEEFFKITIMDTLLNKMHEWRSGTISIPSKYPALISYLGQEDGKIKVLGTGLNDSLSIIGEYAFFEYTFDATLNLLEETWFNLSNPIDISYISSMIKNQAGNYVMTGFLSNPNLSDREIFYCEFTEDGAVLNLHTPSRRRNTPWGLADNAIAQMSNGKYLIHPFNILDEDFNELGYYDDHELILSGRIIPLDATRFLFSGTGVGIDGNTIDDIYNYEALCIGNTNGAVDTIYYNSIQNPTIDWMPGIKSISAVDTNHIYFATSRDGFFGIENTNVVINSININGTVNWSYYFGGDASYTPIDIVTMPDGGCLVFVWKLYRDNPFEQWKADIDYVRFDVDGNLYDLTTSTKDPSFKVLSAIVYPNPASDELYIEYGDQLRNVRIEIVNAAGINVLSEKVNQEAINLQSLSSGMYFYTLYSENEFVQSGKVVIL